MNLQNENSKMQLKNVTYFNHPSWRRVISQLRENFNDLHNQVEFMRTDDDKLKPDNNINLSEICLEANQKYINSIENEVRLMSDQLNETDADIKESFQLILKVWKLCQIIFIKSSPSGALLIDLQEWYKSTNNIDPMVQDLFSTYRSDIDKLHMDQNYWLLVLISVAQGRIDTARHLMSFHPAKNTAAFKAVDEQMRTMPNFSSLGHLSLFEFKAKWEYWQKKCIQVLTNENFASEPTGTLEIICKMLCADERTFLDLKPIFGSWYYMLISLVSYSNPTFNISDLHLHLSSKTCMKQFEEELEEFDIIIHNIFDFDVENVIKDCVDLFSNNLFSSHLMDILYLNGKLQLNKQELSLTVGVSTNGNKRGMINPNINATENASLLHDEHLESYANQLLAAFWPTGSLSMYQIGFDYLLKCRLENNGLDLIEAYMERIPLNSISEMEANKLFNLAFEYNFHDLAFSIGRVMQTRAFKREQYGIAIGWNVRIKDLNFGTILAEKILDTYFKTDDVNLLELTEYLTKEIIYCDRLIFLAKYREFLKLTKYSTSKQGSTIKQHEMKQASQIIVQLIEANNLVPMKYRRSLIMDVLPLVKEGLFSEEQIFSVLRSIQNYENRNEYLDRNSISNSVKKQGGQVDYEEEDHLSNFDGQKWQELLTELSNKLADSFSLKSIEIAAN